MKMKEEKVSISVGKTERVSGVLSGPEDRQTAESLGIIMAHGAGNNMQNPLFVFLAKGLSEAGFMALRFNFPYKERGKRAPDSPGKLMLTWQSAYRFFQESTGTNRIIVSGKSMGGRIASQMVADGVLTGEGLVFFGYPLHPPGKRDKLRDAHLYEITNPMLFLAGTRDPLCDLTALRSVLAKLRSVWDLEVIEGGDHSFRVPKSYGTTEDDTYNQVLGKTIAWLKKAFSS
jgi:predicted alpha/beta-hydrolase family hydrolase